jgi:hypothetical protein
VLKGHNCVITNTSSSKREKGTGKFVPVQAIQAYGVLQVQLHSFLISALDESEWLAKSPTTLSP